MNYSVRHLIVSFWPTYLTHPKEMGSVYESTNYVETKMIVRIRVILKTCFMLTTDQQFLQFELLFHD